VPLPVVVAIPLANLDALGNGASDLDAVTNDVDDLGIGCKGREESEPEIVQGDLLDKKGVAAPLLPGDFPESVLSFSREIGLGQFDGIVAQAGIFSKAPSVALGEGFNPDSKIIVQIAHAGASADQRSQDAGARATTTGKKRYGFAHDEASTRACVARPAGSHATDIGRRAVPKKGSG